MESDAAKNESDSDSEDKPQVRYKRTVLTAAEVKQSQARLRNYPPILLHTLFHEDPKNEEYREREFSQLFFFSDEVKSLGNEAFRKGDYYGALDLYEHVRNTSHINT